MRSIIRIGFVILTWNSEKVIGNCLCSISGLKEVEPFIFVADNGSTDRTVDIIRQYEKKSPDQFTLLKYKRNVGTTVSRNAGIKKLMTMKLDYICILDSDTVVNDETFIKLDAEMKKHSDYGVIGPALVTSGGLLQMSARCFPTVLEKFYKAVPIKSLQKRGELMEIQRPPHPDAVSYPVDYLMSACWLVRPEVFRKAGLLDEKIFYAPEDAEYCIRVWKAGYQVAFCPCVKIIHEWQRLSKKKMISRMNWEHIKGLAHMFRRHRYLFTTVRLKKSFKKKDK